MLTATPRSASRACVHWVAAPTAASVPLVRGRVRAVLDDWRIAADLADTVLLAVSELVGNVVRHAAGAAGRLRVGVSCGGGWLHLEVLDGAAAALPRLPGPGAEAEADTEAEGGRGLLLVQLLTAQAGGELALLADGSGKCVRVRVPVA
ncbi:ATP-binding protein [Streptomyces sp. NPDC048507]|uniref:ATP-binding protein n=1 Tax=Streptomyces sp. NPDC048507 TaxID=3365560 RepID=UPI00371CAE83